jgi:hypothetical protein
MSPNEGRLEYWMSHKKCTCFSLLELKIRVKSGGNFWFVHGTEKRSFRCYDLLEKCVCCLYRRMLLLLFCHVLFNMPNVEILHSSQHIRITGPLKPNSPIEWAHKLNTLKKISLTAFSCSINTVFIFVSNPSLQYLLRNTEIRTLVW